VETTEWFSEDQATFGDRVAGAREAAGLTQKQLAGKIGIKLTTLRGWEDDLTEPRANKLQMLAGLLGVSMTWLLTGQGEGPTEPTEDEISPGVADILSQIRELRVQMQDNVKKMGQLERQLRAALKE
jgi:HTH-type transcriptional regulator, cell division transcriptional repressor